MTNVTPLFGGSPVGFASAGVIELCEQMLARAQRGELRAVAFVTVNGAGQPGAGWYCEPDAMYALVAGCSVLGARIDDLLIEQSEAATEIEDDGA